MPEFKILTNVINFMESNGSTYKVVTFSIDQDLANEINSKHGTKYSVQVLEKAADKCIAHEWIERRSLDGKYDNLGITPKGIGAARSKTKAEELKASRSRLKKISDYIEDHKGLFVALGLIVALATFASKFLRGK